jgi:hypothetical protein
MLTQICFFAWTSKVTAMLIRQRSRQMNIDVDHGHSRHHLIFSSILILWIPARKLRKILFVIHSIRVTIKQLKRKWNYFRLQCRKIDPVSSIREA